MEEASESFFPQSQPHLTDSQLLALLSERLIQFPEAADTQSQLDALHARVEGLEQQLRANSVEALQPVPVHPAQFSLHHSF